MEKGISGTVDTNDQRKPKVLSQTFDLQKLYLKLVH